MEGISSIQKSIINEKKSVFIFKVVLFLFILLSIVEPKQIKALFNLKITWFYPQYIVLTFIILLLIVFKKGNIVIKNSNIGLLVIGYIFSFSYLLSAFMNLNISYDAIFSLQGLFKVLLQYGFSLPLMLILIDNYPKSIIVILKYIFILSFINIILILLGVISFRIGVNLLPIQEVINNQIMHQSWIKVLNFAGFLPKFGGVFPETQGLGLYLLMSYISYILLRKYGVKLNKMLSLYGKLLPVFIILTFSKSVIPGLIFFLIWSHGGKKYFFGKLLLTLFFVVCFLLILSNTYSDSLKYYYDYAMKADSIGERVFHIMNFLKYTKEHSLAFFIGMGPYNYGNYVKSINSALFNKYTNAISIFTVFIESGFIGFATYLLLWGYMIFKSKDFLIKCSLVSLFISNVGQPNWSMYILFIFIITIYNLDRW
jgi:hypothetical protein